MTRVLISSTIRHIPPDQPSGYLYTYDLDERILLRRSEIVEPLYREMDKNPRGGLRGARGIDISDHQITISNASFVFRYDPQWKPISYITHPSCAGIHDVVTCKDHLWVSSTTNDLLIQFDDRGKIEQYIDIRRQQELLSSIKWHPPVYLDEKKIREGSIDYRNPKNIDYNRSDVAHLNSIATLPDGDLLVSCGLLLNPRMRYLFDTKKKLIELGVWNSLLQVNRQARKLLGLKPNMHSDLVVRPAYGHSAVLRLKPYGEARLLFLFDGATIPSHSLRVLGDGSAVYLNTQQGELIHFDPEQGRIHSTTRVAQKFLRGAHQMPDGNLLLGDGRELLHFDLKEKTLLARLPIFDHPSETIFDVHRLPDDFDLPPISFAALHRRQPSLQY